MALVSCSIEHIPTERRRETLVQADAVMRDGATISSAVLALVSRPFNVARRYRNRCPAFFDPAGIINIGCVVVAGDFAANGPKET
jgi:hypothetical protein